MRTGAIFARGSCRALKWLALVGVVCALGAGSAIAQPPSAPTNFEVMPTGMKADGSTLETANTADEGAVLLKWREPSGDGRTVKGYQWSSDGGRTWLPNWTLPSSTEANNAHLRAAEIEALGVGSYVFALRAVHDVDGDGNAGESAGANQPEEISDAVTVTLGVIGVPPNPTYSRNFPKAGNEQVMLQWTATATQAQPIDSYEYRYGLATDQNDGATGLVVTNWSRPMETTATSATVSGLANGSRYVFEVRAVNKAGESLDPIEAAAIPATEPSEPQNLEADTSGGIDGRVVLTWDPPSRTGGSAVTGYEYRVNDDTVWRSPPTALDTAVTLLNLTPRRLHTFYVRAVNIIGPGAAAMATATPTGEVQPPTAPQNLTVTVGNQMVTLAWMAPMNNGGADVTGYEYEMDGDDNWMSVGLMMTREVTDLRNGQQYAFRVRAVNSAGAGEPSTSMTGIPEAQPPSMPLGLTSMPGDGQVTLSWTAPADDGGSAVLRYEYNYSGSWMPATVDTTAATITTTVTGLTNGQSYTFQVRAVNAAGAGDSASVMARPASPAPGMLQNLTAIPGDTQVTLAWEAPATGGPATGYHYRVSSSGVTGSWVPTSSMTTHTVIGLTNGTEYTFEVRGVNATGNGPSATAMSTPMAVVPPVAPGMPQNLTATPGDRQVTLAWEAPATGDAPTEYWYTAKAVGLDGTWYSTSTLTGTVDGLTNGTEYTFEVQASNAAGEGPSATVTATPVAPLEVPGVPRNLTATAGDKQVTLTWDRPNTGGAVASYEYEQDASGTWMDAGTGTTKMVEGLTNDISYIFRVRAKNAMGPGAATDTVKATPVAAPLGPQVTVKSVSTATSVAESGGLEVTVVATVPAGTKGADDKVAPIASRFVTVDFPTNDASIERSERAEAGELTVLSSLRWEKITRTDKESEQTFEFRVAVGQDLDAEDEKFQVEVSIDGASKKSKVITIDDAEEQKFALTLKSDEKEKNTIKEGGSGTLTLEAAPKKTVDVDYQLVLNPNDPSKYTLGAGSSGMFGRSSATATVSAKSDRDREDDTVTVAAYSSGTLGNDVKLTEMEITITDVNALPAVNATLVDKDGKALDPQPESVMEGETVKVMLTAVDKDGKAMKAAEKLTITLMPTGAADAQDYRLSNQSFEIASGKESSAAVDMMVTENQDVGAETLMFDAAVAGESKNGTEKRSVAGVLSLMIEDSTQKLVWANSQEEVEAAIYAAKNAGMGGDMTFSPGEMIEVMGGLLFSAGEGVSVSYTAESDKGDVASASVNGGAVMVTAKGQGMAHITITGHASMPSGVKILDQTDPGMASVMFPVEVGLEALSIMLSGPEDMNLAEGMSAMVTATANRAVTADTTVMLMRDREMSSAGDADYEAKAITISAGEMTGSTMVMAVEDNMAEDMEELVLYGITEGMAGEVTGNVELYLWDAAVPALPVIAQLLLGAFLAIGGYRRYRRR